MKKEKKIALLGCGYWGQNIVRVIYELNLTLENKVCLLLYDKNINKAKELSERFNFSISKDFNEILSDKEVTAVIIATPSSTHYNIALDALENNKDVFVEKPITLSSKEAEKLIHIAESRKKILMAGHIFRFHQGILELKKRIELGEFGQIFFLYGFKFGMAIPKEDAGVNLTLAVNDFDIFCFLLNTTFPESILAHKGTFIRKYNEKDIGLEDIINVSLTFPNNVQGYFIESWLVPVYGRKRELIVVGSKKTAMLDYLVPNEITFYDFYIKNAPSESKEEFILIQENPSKIIFEFQEPLKMEIEHFLNCIDSRKEPITSGKIAYNAIKMCEMANKSAIEGRKIICKEELTST